MSYMDEYQRWLDSPAISNEEWRELTAIADDEKEIESRFFAPLEFGTAGLRGVMGMGLNRMNVHIVRHATQSFAGVVRAEGTGGGVVICYDCRLKSAEFAREAACVMAANGVKAFLFGDMRPTPELSFAIRHYKAAAGINITASHNPKEYNGYKVYWSDGAQLPPEHAAAIAEEMARTDIFSGISRMGFDEAVSGGLIEILGASTDEAFLERVLSQTIDREVVPRAAERLKIVYTPFHGTGRLIVPEALRRAGLKELYPVEEQMVPDGRFPTVKSPNPEEPEGFKLGVELARKIGSDLVIGTDPDADRVGVMVRGGDGAYSAITGNQMGVLLLDYIISARKRAGTLPENAAAIKTIVTTEMARQAAETNGVHIDETFTGFKFMAEKIKEYETHGSYEYVFAFEESYGYMCGGFVRDKDAVTASVLIAEMAAHYMERGMTLLDAMQSLYERYGYFSELTLNIVMPGVDGLRRMAALMSGMREHPPAEIGGVNVLKMRDYRSGVVSVAGLGAVGRTEISGSNVLYFEMEDGSSFIVRPSGTEPKVKVYILARGAGAAECEQKLERYSTFAKGL